MWDLEDLYMLDLAKKSIRISGAFVGLMWIDRYTSSI